MSSYHTELDLNNLEKIYEIQKSLPAFVKQFDVSMSNAGKSTRTRLTYMYDYRIFFEFLLTLPIFSSYHDMTQFTVKDLEKPRRSDIENYLQTFDISRKAKDRKKMRNDPDGKLKARRLASVRSLYSYYCSNGDITANPAAVTSVPHLHDKEIVVLEPDEIAAIFRAIETGAGLSSSRQVIASGKTKLRDKAIFTLLLGTGIRVSECVGLDVVDFDDYKGVLHVVRKGGGYDEVYFADEVEEAVLEYLENERDTLKPETDALFVSLEHGRLTDRAIENMVKKYVQAAGIVKKIKVHTMRATFATELYRETKDVYMVKDALHHSSINTSKHYVSDVTERKQKAARAVKGLFEG